MSKIILPGTLFKSKFNKNLFLTVKYQYMDKYTWIILEMSNKLTIYQNGAFGPAGQKEDYTAI